MTNMMFCHACGKDMHQTAKACPHCGAPQRGQSSAAFGGKPKSKTTATILAFLLGGLGIHRFYLGQWQGLLYLIFCATGIPLILGIIEGFIYLCMSKERWAEVYGNPRNFD